MNPNPQSAIPLYFQIEQDLASLIASGVLAPGSQIPSEEELVQKYGVSRTTVRKAVQELERLGLIEIRRGKGTFVRAAKLTQELTALTGFVEDMVAIGLQPSAKLLSKETVPATEEVARQLRLPIGTEVMQIRRVRMADDVAISLDETYLPLGLGRKVVENDLEVYPIFSLLEGKYDTPLLEADYRIEAVSADPAVAEALGIEEKAPILLIERVSYSLDQNPVDFEKLFYRGDKLRLTTRLQRRPSPIPLEALPRIASKGR
ncbi:GntR family transcriptional regulator [Singulisphaera acidiphila]|uniref:Transcriptional regulator n=1 Tax=Singulisphaera acidiphila (strain ATCC BAA-1392 / DSM 18658 / VKM B-2454 / MOB10) TaxID=886293 RepID=L0DFJ1_SINAD|nr:GntR family transcriptional regulator [Singulisphaera acidiphila]AGA28149.1 transcriptional regulator [Singulisphaera acidiphila DSM 18658]